jgi:hypothetical protein
MIGKRTQYGYVYTGEAFIFLHIPNDPSTVYYWVCVTNMEVLDNDEDIGNLCLTAVGQAFAFVLQALQARPPTMDWCCAAEQLDLWPVEPNNILARISQTPSTEASPSEWSFDQSISLSDMLAPHAILVLAKTPSQTTNGSAHGLQTWKPPC